MAEPRFATLTNSGRALALLYFFDYGPAITAPSRERLSSAAMQDRTLTGVYESGPRSLESDMRALMVAALAAAAATTSTAQAQTDMSRIPFYPWCAIDETFGGQSRNCGFVSYAQCMEYVRGQTGICFENVWGASGPDVLAPEKRPRRR